MIKSVAFYPEYHTLEELPKRLRQIVDGGIDAIRFGEFAWGAIEPEEGRFNWTIFHAAFMESQKLGLKIVLCTPTACPPLWLVDKYPDILPVNDMGETFSFGARQHRCYNSTSMRKAAERVVTALAERYGDHPALYAWQVDNELGAEHKYCYCPTCTSKFQQFLENKYITIEDLNRRMMTTFWSQNYSSFGQIKPPKDVRANLNMKPHPNMMLEFMRFSSDSIAEFTSYQADLVRVHSKLPITTNQDSFASFDSTNLRKLFENLDIASIDIYSEKLYEIGFYADLFRCIKGKPFWMMEFASQSPVLAEAMHLLDQKGCGLMGLFTYFPFPAGQEQHRKALVDTAWNPTSNYYVYRDWQPDSPSTSRKKVGLYYDFDSSWAYYIWNNNPWIVAGADQSFSRLTYQNYLIHVIYRGLFEAGYDVDIYTDPNKISLEVPLVLPSTIIHSAELEKRVEDFLRKGSLLVCDTDLFLKDEDNSFFSVPPQTYRAMVGEETGWVENVERNGYMAFSHDDGEVRFIGTGQDLDEWALLIKSGILDR